MWITNVMSTSSAMFVVHLELALQVADLGRFLVSSSAQIYQGLMSQAKGHAVILSVLLTVLSS